MTETPHDRRSPYAVPYDELVGDAHVSHTELVVEQPHEPPHDMPTHGDAGCGGDGD
jgi:hypothetical protein